MVATWVILKLVDSAIGLRISAAEEIAGIDGALHDKSGYNM